MYYHHSHELRNLGNIRKLSKFQRIIAYFSVVLPKQIYCKYWPKPAGKWKLNFSHSAPFQLKARDHLKYLVHGCTWKQVFWFYFVTGPFKLPLLDNFINSKVFNTVSSQNWNN